MPKQTTDMNFVKSLLHRFQSETKSQVVPQFEVIGEKGVIHVDANTYIGDDDVISQIDSLKKIKPQRAKPSA